MWYNLRMTKVCTRCQHPKPLEEFGNRSNTKDGKDIYCKPCKHYFTQQWKLNNPKKLKDSKRRANLNWYINNKNKKLTANKQWQVNNKDHYKQWFKQYSQKREQLDPSFKLRNKTRSIIWYAIKKNKKHSRVIELIGCSVTELKEHLESKFKDDMTWENYGKWYVDHVIPLNVFDLSNPEEVKRACHYTNLQPLWT